MDHWTFTLVAFVLGSCVGSFLNVVIYRVPLGMSVNEPKRSFCPVCKSGIPMWLNMPLISWLWLRGKCRTCSEPIAFRYFGVELLTALLYAACWVLFRDVPQVVLFLWILLSILIAVTFIDAEHLIIPTRMTTAGTILGLVACAVWPQLPLMAGSDGSAWWNGPLQGLIGFAVGFLGLWLVVELGKRAFGTKPMTFEKPEKWMLREPSNDQDPVILVVGDEEIAWWDMFARKTDKLVIEASALRIDDRMETPGTVTIRETDITLPDGRIVKIDDIKSLSGETSSLSIPREAMGFGDVHLLGMLGAFFGWSGVLFSLFSASLYAILWAIVSRIGFGRQLPFGPFLALGGVTWLFGGWKLWRWYLEFLGPLG